MSKIPLVGKSLRTPKGCHVRWIELSGSVDGSALVGYDCDGNAGRGSYPTPDGGTSNYPKARVKGVRAVHTPGATTTGQARIGFELSPRMVTCRKGASDSEIRCTLHTPEGGTLSGPKRRKGR